MWKSKLFAGRVVLRTDIRLSTPFHHDRPNHKCWSGHFSCGSAPKYGHLLCYYLLKSLKEWRSGDRQSNSSWIGPIGTRALLSILSLPIRPRSGFLASFKRPQTFRSAPLSFYYRLPPLVWCPWPLFSQETSPSHLDTPPRPNWLWFLSADRWGWDSICQHAPAWAEDSCLMEYEEPQSPPQRPNRWDKGSLKQSLWYQRASCMRYRDKPTLLLCPAWTQSQQSVDFIWPHMWKISMRTCLGAQWALGLQATQSPYIPYCKLILIFPSIEAVRRCCSASKSTRTASNNHNHTLKLHWGGACRFLWILRAEECDPSELLSFPQSSHADALLGWRPLIYNGQCLS